MENKQKYSGEVHSEPLQQCSVSRSIFKGTDYFFSGEDEEFCYPLWKHLMWARESIENFIKFKELLLNMQQLKYNLRGE